MPHAVDELKEVPFTKLFRLEKTGNWRFSKPIVDEDKCTKCGICSDYCPDASIKEGSESVEIDYYFCKGCGICSEVCPLDAIEMVED